jgi:hypothetical protein
MKALPYRREEAVVECIQELLNLEGGLPLCIPYIRSHFCNCNRFKEKQGLGDGSDDKGKFLLVCKLNDLFSPWNPRGRKKELIPIGCPLIYIWMCHVKNKNNKDDVRNKSSLN